MRWSPLCRRCAGAAFNTMVLESSLTVRVHTIPGFYRRTRGIRHRSS